MINFEWLIVIYLNCFVEECNVFPFTSSNIFFYPIIYDDDLCDIDLLGFQNLAGLPAYINKTTFLKASTLVFEQSIKPPIN